MGVRERIAAMIIALALALLLLQLDYSRSGFGSYSYYVSSWRDVGVPNLVTAIVADWRAYDSLGEATLLFTAVTGVYLLLGGKKK
ncbi:hypothetical protein JCM16138_21770 [Thermococcus atlanticus]